MRLTPAQVPREYPCRHRRLVDQPSLGAGGHRCWIPIVHYPALWPRPVLASYARARVSLTLFFVWLLETMRTGENGLKRDTYAFQPLLADPLGSLQEGQFSGALRSQSPLLGTKRAVLDPAWIKGSRGMGHSRVTRSGAGSASSSCQWGSCEHLLAGEAPTRSLTRTRGRHTKTRGSTHPLERLR